MATAIPKAYLASSAIRCRDVETGPNLGVLAVFPSTWKWQGEKGPFGNVKRTPLSRRVPINAFSSVERGPSGSVGRP